MGWPLATHYKLWLLGLVRRVEDGSHIIVVEQLLSSGLNAPHGNCMPEKLTFDIKIVLHCGRVLCLKFSKTSILSF